MKKTIALLLAALMLLCLAACSNGKDAIQPNGPAQGRIQVDDGVVFRVGIVQLVQHEALDRATQGFMDALAEELGTDHLEIDLQNASGDIPTCSTIVNTFVSNDVDLILANATPALVAAANATSEIPVLGTSITDYATALEIDNFNGTVGGNVSGTSDLAPLDEQAEMVLEFAPDAKRVGILYCSAEPNSVYQADQVEAYLTKQGVEVERYTFTDSSDVGGVTATACSQCGAIYIPTDNTAAACGEAIHNASAGSGVPIISGEENACRLFGVATLSIDYYKIGQIAGQMAAKILVGEADISAMPIEFDSEPVRMYNPAICEELGITPPEGYQAIE